MYRRSFLSGLTTGLFGAGDAVAGARKDPMRAGEPWEPARHAQDDWFDQVPGRHRIFFDTVTAPKVHEAVQFAGNYLNANKSAYGLDDRDLAVVIGLRHRATPFAFNDAM